MSDRQLLERITINPKTMAGKPIVRGTHLTVEYIVNLLAHSATAEEILQEYEGVAQEDIQVCLLLAAQSLEGTAFMPLAVDAA